MEARPKKPKKDVYQGKVGRNRGKMRTLPERFGKRMRKRRKKSSTHQPISVHKWALKTKRPKNEGVRGGGGVRGATKTWGELVWAQAGERAVSAMTETKPGNRNQ